jgi:tRNA (cytidine/uridine-2'-O-)-methyltransferase
MKGGNKISSTFTEEMRLRFEPAENPFKILLVEPEIPLNTGSIARLCAATGSKLIIIGEPSFKLNSSELLRAGVDYWDFVKFERYQSLNEYLEQNKESNLFFFSAKGRKSYLECDVKAGDSLIFGKESVGLPDEIIYKYYDRLFAIPTVSNIRSLNLSNAVAIVLYEALRKSGLLNNIKID